MWSRTVAARRGCAIGPSVVFWSSGSSSTYCLVSDDEAVDELVVDVGMHIDALDAAAALAGIEIGAVDDVLDRVREIDIGAHIGRVLAAELQPDAREGAGRSPLDRLPGRDRAREADLVDAARRDQLRGVVVRERQRAEQAASASPALSIAA